MRSLLLFGFTIFSFIGYCQSDQNYIVISELRLGENGKFVAPYEDYNRAKFKQFKKPDGSIIDEIEVDLVEKEEYYFSELIKGTEIRFHIPKRHLGSQKEIEFSGDLELQTVIEGEQIRCRLQDPLTIKLKDRHKISPNIYKLDIAIELFDPAKFTLVSVFNLLNRMLNENNSSGPSYLKEVEKIMQFKSVSGNKQKELLKTCYEIYALIEPIYLENTYYPNEYKELVGHIKQLNIDLKNYASENYNGAESQVSLERDLFESKLVARKYLELREKLLPLKLKIESILFISNKDQKMDSTQNSNTNSTINSNTTTNSIANTNLSTNTNLNLTANENCDKNIDFNLIAAVSYSTSPSYFNKHFLDAGDTIRQGQNALSFSLVGMTNIYLTKRRMLINPSISLGIGANFQGNNIGLGGFFGGGLAFGKKRDWGINIGMSYLPIRELNPTFEIDQPIPDPFLENEVIRSDYKWSPFISATIPINWILGLFSSSKSSSSSSGDL